MKLCLPISPGVRQSGPGNPGGSPGDPRQDKDGGDDGGAGRLRHHI